MNSKHMKRVLRNGPDKEKTEDLVVAAWLIQNGYAHGNVQLDHTQMTEIPKNVLWRGITEKGHELLHKSALKEKVFAPLFVTVVGGLIVAAVVGFVG